MNFENVFFNKFSFFSFLCDKEHGCIIYVMYNQGTTFLKYNACSCEFCVEM